MAPGSGLHLVDTRAKTVRNLYAAGAPSVRADRTKYANCPGPLDPKQAVLHGLSLRPAQTGRYTVYATNHGGRESIEVFELDTRGAAPSATWIGCVLMPDRWRPTASRRSAMARSSRRCSSCRARHSKTRLRAAPPARSSSGRRRHRVPPAARHRACGQQRHRDVARRSRVLRRLDDDEADRRVFAQQSRRAAPHRTAHGIRAGQRPLDERQPPDHRRDDRQRAVMRRTAKDRSGDQMLARLHRGDDRSEDDGRHRESRADRRRRRSPARRWRCRSATSCGSARSTRIGWPIAR